MSVNIDTTTFTFSVSEPRSTLKCSISGPTEIAPFDCPESYNIPANTLLDGSYTLTVSAIDASNIEGTATTFSFDVTGNYK
jgi:hypothetical protein